MREYFRQFFESGEPVEVTGIITRFGSRKRDPKETIVDASSSGMLCAPILFSPPNYNYSIMPIISDEGTTLIELTEVNGVTAPCGAYIWYGYNLELYGYHVGSKVSLRANVGIYQHNNNRGLDFCLLPDTITIK